MLLLAKTADRGYARDMSGRPVTTDFGCFVPNGRFYTPGAPAGGLSSLNFAVKDLIDVKNHVTGAGNPDWARTQVPAECNAAVVDRLLAAGATLVGKTVTDELAFSLEGDNAHYGTPRNPRCPERLPGGSSSGSAVAVAAGLVDFALGTDTGGSVRVPAGFCGIFGFRPSHGRVPLAGVVPFAPSYDTIGWFARDGASLARVGEILLDKRVGAAPRRLLLASDAFALCDAPCASALRHTAETLGAEATVALFDGEEALWLECYRVLQGAEIWASLGAWISENKPRFGATIAPRFAEAAQISPELATEFLPVRRHIAARLAAMLPADTAILLPTAPSIALPKPLPPAALGEFYRRALTLTCAAGHAGLPQVSLPLAESDGCPVGLSVLGAAGADEGLLALAASLRVDRAV